MSASSVIAPLLHPSPLLFLNDSDKKIVKNGPVANCIILVMHLKVGTRDELRVRVMVSLPSRSSSRPAAAAGAAQPRVLL